MAKTLRSFENCLSVGKLVSPLESPIMFEENFRATSVVFFTADFNLLSCELDSLTFKLYIE